MEKKSDRRSDWEIISGGCPWRYESPWQKQQAICKASGESCLLSLCALMLCLDAVRSKQAKRKEAAPDEPEY
jgi:hypothetical protein